MNVGTRSMIGDTSKNIKAHEGNGYVFDYRVHIKSFPKTTKFAYIK